MQELRGIGWLEHAGLSRFLAVAVVATWALLCHSQPRDVTAGPVPGVAKYRSAYGNSWAVVIGIDAYEKLPHLNAAVADARAVADLLPSLGFPEKNIFLLLDAQATKGKIESTLYRDLRGMGPDDRLLVYFAGHGETEPIRTGDEGYILPVDADPDALPLTALAMTDIKHIADRLKAKHYLFVMDACFSGFAVTRAGSGKKPSTEFFAAALREPVVEAITAGRKGEQTIEDQGHGMFTRRLLEGLRGSADPEGQGFVSAAQLASWIAPKVADDSKGRMTPQYGKLDGEGQFLFIMPGKTLQVPAEDLTGTFTGLIQGTANGTNTYAMPVSVTFVQRGKGLSGTWTTSVGSSGSIEGFVDGLQLHAFKVDQTNPCHAVFRGAASADATRNVIAGSYSGTDCSSQAQLVASFRVARISKEETFDIKKLEPQDLLRVAMSYLGQSRYLDAVEYAGRAARGSKAAGNRHLYGTSLAVLGLAHEGEGQEAEAAQLFTTSLDVLRDIRDKPAQAVVLNLIGLAHLNKSRLLAASDAFAQSLQLAREIKDRQQEARALYNLGLIAQRNGNKADAEKLFTQAWTLGDQLSLGERGLIRQSLDQIKGAR